MRKPAMEHHRSGASSSGRAQSGRDRDGERTDNS
jgi:hypothetical protein